MPTEEENKPPEAGAENPQDKAPEGNQQESEENFDKDRALETIRKQRESEKKLEKELKDAKAALAGYQSEEKKRKDAELSDLEKTQTRVLELEKSLTEAQTMIQALRLQQSFRSTTAKLNLKFASEQAEEDAFELADLSEVEIGSDGKVTGLDEAIKDLQKSRPYLFSAGDNSSQGTPKRPKVQGNADGKEGRYAPPIIKF